MEDNVLQGVNVVAYSKDGKDYAMTCAWTTSVDYDSIMLLIGAQSDTGNHLKVGDKVGVSALNENQKDIASKLGENHSLSTNKLENIECYKENGAILIKDAKTNLYCEVTNVTHPKCSKDDHLIECKILRSKENTKVRFLSMPEMR